MCYNDTKDCDRNHTIKDVSSSQIYVPRLERMLDYCMSKLPIICPFEPKDSTEIAWFIYDSMVTDRRVYHSIEHVFEISKEMTDPIMILSAMFHDTIYVQIDELFSEKQRHALEGVLASDTEQLDLVDELDDPLISTIVQLFGFTLGEALPKRGTNEFLSGVTAVRLLSKWLPRPYLIQMMACIEATIPFRPIIDKHTPMDRLYKRLVDVASEESEEWVVETMKKAVATANCDLGSFNSDDCDFFIDSTWKLIPETRPILLHEDCPLIEYLSELKALEERSTFLVDAVPKIFQSFGQEPPESEMEAKQQKAHKNLDTLMQYANVRLLQLMVLVEFTRMIDEQPQGFKLRPFLNMEMPGTNRIIDEELTNTERQVRHWLVKGRKVGFKWDPAVSSLGGYLFDTLGSAEISRVLKVGENQIEGTYDILRCLPAAVIHDISSSLAVSFPNHAEAFLRVPQKLGIISN